MKSKIVRTAKLVLELTKEEAEWLNAVVQNPLDYHIEPVGETQESDRDTDMRVKFFNATDLLGK